VETLKPTLVKSVTPLEGISTKKKTLKNKAAKAQKKIEELFLQNSPPTGEPTRTRKKAVFCKFCQN